MLDIHFIRENPDLVKEGARKKGVDVDVDRLLAVDAERKMLRQDLDDRKAEQNRMSSTIQRAEGTEKAELIERMRHVKEGASEVQERYDTLTAEWEKLLLSIPNIPSPDTPEGPDESGNKVIRSWGEKPSFPFAPKAHWDIGKELDIIDTEKAAEISGARFNYIKGDLVLLQYGIVSFVFSVLTSREKLAKIAEEAGLAVDPKPFIPVIPPIIMRAEVMGRMARLHPIDERYYFEKDNQVLIGSAEHTLGPLHMDEIIEESALPIRYIGYSPSFRREAGAAGKDTRGILRQHQFDKLEMETFVRPEDGYLEQDFLVAIQEHLTRLLGLPYQTVLICTGDMGKPDQRQLDIEMWMPGQDVYRETHSADYMGGYQARRLNTRLRDKEGNLTHVHMNDATAFAMSRTLAAILENYQQEDGSVKVPEALIPYVGKEVIRRTS